MNCCIEIPVLVLQLTRRRCWAFCAEAQAPTLSRYVCWLIQINIWQVNDFLKEKQQYKISIDPPTCNAIVLYSYCMLTLALLQIEDHYDIILTLTWFHIIHRMVIPLSDHDTAWRMLLTWYKISCSFTSESPHTLTPSCAHVFRKPFTAWSRESRARLPRHSAKTKSKLHRCSYNSVQTQTCGARSQPNPEALT